MFRIGVFFVVLSFLGSIYFVSSQEKYTVEAKKIEPLPGLVIGNPKNPNILKYYFSPSCGACSDYHKNNIKEIEKDLVKKNQLKIVLYILPLNEFDLFISRLAFSVEKENTLETILNRLKNPLEVEKIINRLKFITTHQEEWLTPVFEKNPKKELEKKLKTLSEKLKTSTTNIEKRLDIKEKDDPLNFIKIFALNHGYSDQEIRGACKENIAFDEVLLCTYDVTRKNGKNIPGVPFFILNNEKELEVGDLKEIKDNIKKR